MVPYELVCNTVENTEKEDPRYVFFNFYVIETSSLRIPFIILHSILVGDNLIPVVEVLVTFCKNHPLLTTMSQKPFKTADYLSKNALYITH